MSTSTNYIQSAYYCDDCKGHHFGNCPNIAVIMTTTNTKGATIQASNISDFTAEVTIESIKNSNNPEAKAILDLIQSERNKVLDELLGDDSQQLVWKKDDGSEEVYIKVSAIKARKRGHE